MTYVLVRAAVGSLLLWLVGCGGNGSGGAADAPPTVDADQRTVTAVTTGFFHTCVILSDGAVRCWGSGFFGQLGYVNTNGIGDDEPASAAGDVNVGGVATQLVAGRLHTCARLDSGSVRCWGDGFFGQTGYARTAPVGDNETPASVGDVDVGGATAEVSAGRQHTCALLASGAVRCWGDAAFGQLGYGNTNNIGDNETPASAGDVSVGGGVVVGVRAGGGGDRDHTCVLMDNMAVRCWGDASTGQLGYGNTNTIGDDELPSTVGDVDVGGPVVKLVTGMFHSCVLLASGAVRCWGDGQVGQLGYGNTNHIGDNETPASAGDVDVGGTVVALTAGGRHTCALLEGGVVRCWGQGQFGELGYGNTNNIGDNETPASAGDVDVGGAVVQISASERHTCALLAAGGVRCWGTGSEGQLGHGNVNNIGDNETPASAGDVPVL